MKCWFIYYFKDSCPWLLVAWNGLMKCTIRFKVSWFFSSLWEPLCKYQNRNLAVIDGKYFMIHGFKLLFRIIMSLTTQNPRRNQTVFVLYICVELLILYVFLFISHLLLKLYQDEDNETILTFYLLWWPINRIEIVKHIA